MLPPPQTHPTLLPSTVTCEAAHNIHTAWASTARSVVSVSPQQPNIGTECAFDEHWMDGWMGGWVDEQVDGWMGRWMDEQMLGWVDEQVDGWMSGLVDR